jgi:hypothetical protein
MGVRMVRVCTLLVALCLLVSCGKSENGMDSPGLSLQSQADCLTEEGTCERDVPQSRGLISVSDMDISYSISKARYSSVTLPVQYSKPSSGSRNNTYNKLTVTYRKSSEVASKRNALSGLSGATVTTAGLNTYTAKGTVVVPLRNAVAGTYYLYYKFETNGEDVMTYIYRLIITN